jgi:hypothetical protein
MTDGFTVSPSAFPQTLPRLKVPRRLRHPQLLLPALPERAARASHVGHPHARQVDSAY